jgi:hypothetical protein
VKSVTPWVSSWPTTSSAEAYLGPYTIWLPSQNAFWNGQPIGQ